MSTNQVPKPTESVFPTDKQAKEIWDEHVAGVYSWDDDGSWMAWEERHALTCDCSKRVRELDEIWHRGLRLGYERGMTEANDFWGECEGSVCWDCDKAECVCPVLCGHVGPQSERPGGVNNAWMLARDSERLVAEARAEGRKEATAVIVAWLREKARFQHEVGNWVGFTDFDRQRYTTRGDTYFEAAEHITMGKHIPQSPVDACAAAEERVVERMAGLLSGGSKVDASRAFHSLPEAAREAAITAEMAKLNPRENP